MSESQDMKYEEVRLATFRRWPANAKVEAWKMAKAGLLYTGQEEEVQCTFCGCVIAEWQFGDQVMTKHREASPNCPFVTNQSDNVPLVPKPPGPTSSNQGVATTPTTSGLVSAPVPHEEDDTDDVGLDLSRESAMDEAPSSPRVAVEAADSTRVHEDMKHEETRLASFSNWPLTFLQPVDLAKAGFYYLNQRDNCRCAFCGNYVGEWDEGDLPMEEHAKLFPLCGFVRGLPVGNVPRESGDGRGSSRAGSSSRLPHSENHRRTLGHAERPSGGEDETGIRWHRSPNGGPERGSGFSENFPEEMGVISHHGPLHPSYATPEARLRTFREWPPALKQQPKELADAGFYYIGLSDQVKCFYCDGGLRNWQPEDDPWMEHARWFKKCVFVRLKKGDEFIKQCLAAKPPENSQEDELRNEQREVTEDEVRAAMSEAIVRQVLSMGIDASRVKMAIKRQLEKHGAGFNNPEHLIRAAFSVQRDQERRVNNENNNPSGALLGTSRGGGASADIVPRSQEAGSSARGVDEVTSSWEVPPAQPPQAPRPAQPMSDYDEDDEEEEEEEDDDDVEDEARPSRPSPTISSPSPAPFRSLPPAGSTSVIQRTPQYNQSSAAASSQSVPSSPVVLQTPPKEDPAKLEEENQRLKEQRTCKVCMDGEVGVVFLPCGHLICCVNCAPSLKDCPVCRTLIQGTVRTFMS